jgi:uncharacterized protein YecE (DUF72 family)
LFATLREPTRRQKRLLAEREDAMAANARIDHRPACRIGTAGWSIPKQHAAAFAPSGNLLERYARRFNAVEINTSFHRPHRRTTYERWAASVPENFAFAVKIPKTITHEQRLADSEAVLDTFLAQAGGLGDRLAVLLVQLPPSLAFDQAVAAAFFTAVRARHRGDIVCEPRHPTWFEPYAEQLLAEHAVGRVAADPAVVPAAAEPGGWPGLHYRRLHGAPAVYRSAYQPEQIARIAQRLQQPHRAWCIFDNTTLGAATANALALSAMVA